MKVYIEADSIASERMSGIGHATLEIIRGFDRKIDQGASIKLTVLVPYGKKSFVRKRYNFRNIEIRSLPPGYKYVNYALTRTSLPIPADLWFGRGVYIFPNYKTWYVPFSKSITFVHDLVFKEYPQTVNPKNLAYLEANFRRWLQRTAKVISISEASKNEFNRYFPDFKNKVEVIHLGIDPSIYNPRSESEIRNILQKYELPPDYFLYVGNIEPRKNLSNLLDAYKLYSDATKNPTALLIVGGGGWHNQAIKEKMAIMQAGGYRLYHPSTYIPDEALPALYSGASAYVNAAIHEGFGLPPLQAQACGTPVIASNILSHKEILNPKNTIFVSPQDIQEIAKAFAVKRKRIISSANYTWDNTVEKLYTLSDKIST